MAFNDSPQPRTGLLSAWIGNKRRAQHAPAGNAGKPRPVARPQPFTGHGGPAVRRQLVSLALRDTLRRHGIPLEWVGAETLALQDAQFGEVVHAHLILRHWEPRLLEYTPAFEHSLRDAIAKFDPAAQKWLHSITWKIAPQDGSPSTAMPPTQAWAPPEVEPVEPGFEETTFGDA